MRRSEVRETIFRLLFMKQFRNADEMNEQVTVYFDEMKNGLADEPYAQSITFADEAYIREKLAKIIEKIPEIDEKLNQVSRGWKTSRMGSADLSALRLAVYEILYDEEIPTGVAINEAVELAKHYGTDESGSFVNGILGKIARDAEQDTGQKPDKEQKPDAEPGQSAEQKQEQDAEQKQDAEQEH